VSLVESSVVSLVVSLVELEALVVLEASVALVASVVLEVLVPG
jgi:hypothetical protein